jgi:hypothetical protein
MEKMNVVIGGREREIQKWKGTKKMEMGFVSGFLDVVVCKKMT